MMILIQWLISALVIMVGAYLIPAGVTLRGFIPALAVALVLGIINAVIKPVLLILTLPINILTLGLFTFVINALMILLVSAIVPGFKVNGFWWALLFSLILSVLNYFIAVSRK